MKMDIDCIRDILLEAEDGRFIVYNLGYEENNDFSNLAFISKYELEKLIYHIDLTKEFDFIKVSQTIGFNDVHDLTAEGHLFLADIRSDNVWRKTKEISKRVGVSSLDAVKQIAVGVVTSLISNQLK